MNITNESRVNVDKTSSRRDLITVFCVSIGQHRMQYRTVIRFIVRYVRTET